MSDYTPTEEQLIEAWAHQECFNPTCSGGCPERFPAMRAINKAKAEAWDEGYRQGAYDESRYPAIEVEARNPYTEES